MTPSGSHHRTVLVPPNPSVRWSAVALSNAELSPGEEVLVDAHPHWIVLAAPAVVTVVAVAAAAAVAAQFSKAPTVVAWVLVAMVAVPAAWLVRRAVHRSSINLVVTTHRILLQRGILRREVTQLRMARVKEVHCTQTFGERLIGSGRLILEVGDEDGAFVVDDVRRPRALQRVIGSRIGELEPEGQFDAPALDADATPPHGVPVVDGRQDINPPPPPASGDQRVDSVHRQLVEIDDLRRRGILTEEEFERKKADLLSRL
jgi:membrane protein YdbS with pleckstrin-like domain